MKEDRREYLAEWMQGMNPDTKGKLKLAKRNLATGTWYYIKEPLEGRNRHKWVALGTQDKDIANRIFTEASSKLEYGDTELGTVISMKDEPNRSSGHCHPLSLRCRPNLPKPLIPDFNIIVVVTSFSRE